MKKRLADSGVEPLVSTPDEFAAFIRSETQRYARVVKEAGIKAQ
jgi:tripartite-type tricarboxylate transporter receptor subunit TctC